MQPWILGGHQTDFARSWSKGERPIDLINAVLPAALDQAGIEAGELVSLVDDDRVAGFVGNFDGQEFSRQGHLGAWLGESLAELQGMRATRYESACASGAMALEAACSRIRAGEIDVALVVGVEIMRSADARTIGDFLGTCADYRVEAEGVDFVFPKNFGQLADRAIALSSIEESRFVDALTWITRTNYGNAKANPNAQTRRWDIDGEKMLGRAAHLDPLLGGRTRYLDCSQITDGAAAIVVSSSTWAERRGVEAGSVAAVYGTGHRNASLRMASKLDAASPGALIPWTQRAIADAYRRAEVTAADIDVVETHDCFTISEYLQLSAFGLADPGHEYQLIEDGAIARDGRIPVNPSGGLIGLGHPVGATGVRMAFDLFKQVTGRAGDYQVNDAKMGAILNIGGNFATNLASVIGRADIRA